MADSLALLNAAAPLLALALALHWPGLTRQVPRALWWLAAAGALIPLLDPLVARFAGEDRIGTLTRTPLFAGPLSALALIGAAALAVAIWSGWRPGLATLAAPTAGLLLHLALAALTPWGVPWLAPFDLRRWGVGVFPPGHPVWIALLATAVLALEAFPAMSRWLRRVAGGACAAYAAVAVAGHLFAALQAPPPPAGVSRTVEPGGLSPLRWRIIDRTASEYRVLSIAIGQPMMDEPRRIARWNDEPLALLVLEDPLARRLYIQAFRHPVAELGVSDSQTTLVVQELSERLTGEQGPAFLFQSGADGRNRLYRLERFE
jgi:hypothetical protein